MKISCFYGFLGFCRVCGFVLEFSEVLLFVKGFLAVEDLRQAFFRVFTRFFWCVLVFVFFWDVVFRSLVDTLVISDFGFL